MLREFGSSWASAGSRPLQNDVGMLLFAWNKRTKGHLNAAREKQQL